MAGSTWARQEQGNKRAGSSCALLEGASDLSTCRGLSLRRVRPFTLPWHRFRLADHVCIRIDLLALVRGPDLCGSDVRSTAARHYSVLLLARNSIKYEQDVRTCSQGIREPRPHTQPDPSTLPLPLGRASVDLCLALPSPGVSGVSGVRVGPAACRAARASSASSKPGDGGAIVRAQHRTHAQHRKTRRCRPGGRAAGRSRAPSMSRPAARDAGTSCALCSSWRSRGRRPRTPAPPPRGQRPAVRLRPEATRRRAREGGRESGR